ncbi:uncharacterized protein LOC109825367 [Asparagus officinalis]|uniref:uncharacterized protein LOC109825367 n=1 Tax=Asparagus officinalis TaxID=4686 RepID=UPI00098DEC44|nr:uncharacterized protein LOC109825367 [Asparagus officinalis]
MATSFFKSLQCKSTALDDVVCVPKPKKALIPAGSCGGSTQTLRDVVFLLPKKPPEDEPIHHPPTPSRPSPAKPNGGATESGGVGPRRRCWVQSVIVGRVRSGSDPESRGESVCGAGKGELVVLDPRAVLPCFLIIYKI